MSGSITIKVGSLYYALEFPSNGWLAAELVQYLGDVIESAQPELEVLKLLGYTIRIQPSKPDRTADQWVEVDLQRRELVTNSDVVRKAVEQEQASADDPYTSNSLRRMYALLDKYDFTVRLRK